MARYSFPIVHSPAPRIVLPKKNCKLGGGDDAAPFNVWFSDQFPEAVKQWGPGFLESRHEDLEGFTVFTPVEMNSDAWAAALGGRREIGTRVVFFPPEHTFYFFDYRAAGVGAFCPVSEPKLQLLVSNYLMRCAEACDRSVDVQPLFSTFRKTESLKAVTDKAKILLEADGSFFSAVNGKRRIIEGRIVEANAPETHQAFIQDLLIPEPESSVTLTQCYHAFIRYVRELGLNPPGRKEFRTMMSMALLDAYQIRERHDVRNQNGKQTNGWKGITLRRDVSLISGNN